MFSTRMGNVIIHRSLVSHDTTDIDRERSDRTPYEGHMRSSRPVDEIHDLLQTVVPLDVYSVASNLPTPARSPIADASAEPLT